MLWVWWLYITLFLADPTFAVFCCLRQCLRLLVSPLVIVKNGFSQRLSNERNQCVRSSGIGFPIGPESRPEIDSSWSLSKDSCWSLWSEYSDPRRSARRPYIPKAFSSSSM